jgi:predicted nucleotidyltransferase
VDHCIGVVAEYNPFHRGHAYHLARAKEPFAREGQDVPVVVALSGCFSQRGMPALCDKWARARMALAGGADLVLELPAFFSSHCGMIFARGAIELLLSTGIVTHLAFGVEDAAFPIRSIARILARETDVFKEALRACLSRGFSYSKAIAEAVEAQIPGAGNFMAQPNNSLAVSYFVQLERRAVAGIPPLTPLPVQRVGQGYHERAAHPMASATAIRGALARDAEGRSAAWLSEALPRDSLEIIETCRASGRLALKTEGLWLLLQGLLLRSTHESLERYAGMEEGLAGLFLKHWRKASSLDDFLGRMTSARHPKSRLQRQALWLLLGLDRWQDRALQRLGPGYLRVLGATERGLDLLRDMRHRAALPVITRTMRHGLGSRFKKERETSPPSRGEGMRVVQAKALMEFEFKAAALWELLIPGGRKDHEETQIPLMPPSVHKTT